MSTDETKMVEEKSQMARIIAFELCPYKYHKDWWGENAQCYSDNNFAHCPRIKEVVDKLYNANYCKVADDEIVINKNVYDLEKAFYKEKCAEFDLLCYDYHKAEKETAKEIFRQLQGHGTTYVKKWIKNKYGIESED